ncbi:hypothetical protein [Agrobacterium sp. Azo12]|uniref:hypothetical protein n=1 Tax=Agrobacterium sp. Azo12 TaxID=3031129 RepID=UPI0023D82519|nr:hypothetical protein [Agrobacterium sp. Azo12]MDO5895834.1 hypothetical protein [Agrobacterium sp. Azo12]
MTDLYVAKLPDRAIISLLVELKETFGTSSLNIDIGGITLQEDGYEKIIQTKGATYFIKSFTWYSDPTKFMIGMDRGTVHNGLNPAYYDFISFSPQSGHAQLDDVLIADAILKKHVSFPKVNDARELAKDTIGIIDRETAALSQLHVAMLENAEELRAKYESDAALRRQQFEEQQLTAEEDIRRREAEALDRIKTEQVALDERFKQFDQSDHMFARRKQREEISAQVQDFLVRPQGSISTQLKFTMLVGAVILASGAAGYFAYETFLEFISLLSREPANPSISPAIPDRTYLIWFLGVRGGILSATCIGFALYLINMVRKSHDEELEYQHQLRRYGMDINRASWVIETAMEMTTKEGAALPERWIEGACAGLFQVDDKKDAEVSSLAALGAVMGLGPEVTVGPNGASFKIPSKGAKKAANDAD